MDSQHTVANSELKDEMVNAKISIPQPPEPETSKKIRRKKKWESISWEKHKKFNLRVVIQFIWKSA